MSGTRGLIFAVRQETVAANHANLACLDLIQRQLQSIYDVNVPYAVSDFIITDQQALSRITDGKKDHLREKLLVQQSGEELGLSLYLHPDVIQTLIEQTEEIQLAPEHLENLCLAIEGTSHFLYLVWRALRLNNVSLLELELQAEVDKYILVLFLIRRQKKFGLGDQLRKILYEHIKYDEALDDAELFRYREANNYAARYCHMLESCYVQDFSNISMVRELREFYRLGQNAKMRRIDNSC